MHCPFCDPNLAQRVYFRDHGWFALLDANGMLPGHSIVARQASGGCPDVFKTENLEGLHLVLPKIADVLQSEYGATNVLVTSLRGKVRHVHFHLVPMVPAVEAAWRQHAGWDAGHLHEFLGHHENVSAVRNIQERANKGWTPEQQFGEHVEQLSEQTQKLKELFNATA